MLYGAFLVAVGWCLSKVPWDVLLPSRLFSGVVLHNKLALACAAVAASAAFVFLFAIPLGRITEAEADRRQSSSKPGSSRTSFRRELRRRGSFGQVGAAREATCRALLGLLLQPLTKPAWATSTTHALSLSSPRWSSCATPSGRRGKKSRTSSDTRVNSVAPG